MSLTKAIEIATALRDEKYHGTDWTRTYAPVRTPDQIDALTTLIKLAQGVDAAKVETFECKSDTGFTVGIKRNGSGNLYITCEAAPERNHMLDSDANAVVNNILTTLATTQAALEAKEKECERLNGMKIYQSRMHTEAQNGNCFATCLTFLLEMGEYKDMPQWDKELEWADYYLAYQKWLAKRGLTSCRMEGHPNIDGYYIASGPSPRGTIRHSVIYKNGELFHDPHPSNEGIANVEFVEILVDVGWSQSFYESERDTALAEAERLRKIVSASGSFDEWIATPEIAGRLLLAKGGPLALHGNDDGYDEFINWLAFAHQAGACEAERLRGELEELKKHNEFILSRWPGDAPAPVSVTTT